MVDERDSVVVCMVAIFLCLLGCCVLVVHFIIPIIPKKRSDFPAVFLVSLVSLVWSTYVIYSPKQKTQSVVCGCLVLMPLWTDAIGVFLFLYRRCVGGRFVTFSGSTSWVLPRGVGFSEFVRIGEVARTDPLLLYVEVVFLVLVCRSVWLYGDMVDSDRTESGCLLISCRLMVSLAVCIHALQKRKDLGEFRFV